MDINLTGLIATNTTVIQPWYNGPVIGAAGVIVGAVIAGGVNLIRDIYKTRTLGKQQKQEIYFLAY